MKEDKPVEQRGFWADKTPCWAIRGCIPEARLLCEAYRDPSRPCWEQRCLCKKMFDIDTCFVCEVYERYGHKRECAGNPVGSQ